MWQGIYPKGTFEESWNNLHKTKANCLLQMRQDIQTKWWLEDAWKNPHKTFAPLAFRKPSSPWASCRTAINLNCIQYTCNDTLKCQAKQHSETKWNKNKGVWTRGAKEISYWTIGWVFTMLWKWVVFGVFHKNQRYLDISFCSILTHFANLAIILLNFLMNFYLKIVSSHKIPRLIGATIKFRKFLTQWLTPFNWKSALYCTPQYRISITFNSI